MDKSAHPLALVAEDEELLRLHAAGLLEEHGFTVLEAKNADAALKVMETRDDVRLLFTDIQMPRAPRWGWIWCDMFTSVGPTSFW
jgi:CheY-like chemotaxis protein